MRFASEERGEIKMHPFSIPMHLYRARWLEEGAWEGLEVRAGIRRRGR
jgi:hypothetical protein